VLFAIGLASPSASHALIFEGPETEPAEALPPDFPYWEHVTQRRYQGPSVIYLGGGWALTARHVGHGEVLLQDRVIAPERSSKHTLLNIDGSLADAMLFELDREATIPDLPLIPIAQSPPEVGEEVLLIGFGREREKVVEWPGAPPDVIGLRWTRAGNKRWGTNRILLSGEWITQQRWMTRSMVLRFDAQEDPGSTRHEAHAATGDSGGAVFIRRKGGWELAGMITSVSSSKAVPKNTSVIGDLVYAADLSSYRSEILRWARPACANEEDDDGDGLIDFPEDPDCAGPTDRDERARPGWPTGAVWALGGVAGVFVLLGAGVLGLRRRRGAQRTRSTPSSTSASTAL
jgi:hypothetical protein